ncbi:MAG: hypothetical protein HY549_07100 [Elusimicrobia bacterium]|nr:hypothetical protein [Elusimicrobiota bacterium]
MNKTKTFIRIFLSFCLWRAPQAAAWGERGHHAIARIAAMRVATGTEDEKALAALFRSKAIQLGHLSNVPDTAWRNMDKETSALNGPTHYMDADYWTDDIGSIPLDYQEAFKRFNGKPNKIDGKPIDLFQEGTLIWRSQQLYDLMVSEFHKAKTAAPGSAEYKRAVHQALVYGGLLAHFVGDASMPYHNSHDYDGAKTGHAGVHAYFEMETPDSDDPGLESAVYQGMPQSFASLKLEQEFSSGGSRPAAHLTRLLSERAFARLGELERLDGQLILERSKGKSPAKRKPAQEALAAFRPMIVEQLAESSAVLARLWRGAWEQAGKPDLSEAKFWDYAHKPDFVVPSYDEAAVTRIKAKTAAN